MENNLYSQLSRRERQIMDIIFELREATANEVQERLPDPPSNSSVRNMLKTMEERRYLAHRVDKGQFIYRAVIEPDQAQRSALRHVLTTFFGGSIPRIVSTLLSEQDLTPEEIAELENLIEQARKEDE